MHKEKNQNKKGQVGDTITWFIATVAIIAILMFFIFGASMLGSTKSVGKYKESLTSRATYEGDDVFLKKTIFTYLAVDGAKTKANINKYLEAADEEDKFKVPAKETLTEVRSNHARKE